MKRHPDFHVAPDSKLRAALRDDYQIEWRPDRSELNAREHLHITVEIAQKRAAGAHLAAAGIRNQISHHRAVVRHRNCYETFDAIDSAKPLHIIARDQSSHAESDEIEFFTMRKSCVDEW